MMNFSADPTIVEVGVRLVRISRATAWQRFHGCEPEYIQNVCKGRCCEAPSRPGGTMITIHRSEADAIRARGGQVKDGLLVTDGRCTFKDDAGLCGLHFTPDKPLGCIASPWTLARGGRSLIVRNRYRGLICYAATAARKGVDTSDYKPAFVAFRAGLDLILGQQSAEWLCEALGTYGPPDRVGPEAFWVPMDVDMWTKLVDNDNTKRGH